MRTARLLRTAVKIKDAHLFKENYEKSLDKAGRITIKPGKGEPTGLTGLYQHPNPIPTLTQVYDITLNRLKELPEHSVYRTSVENLTKSRKQIVEESQTREQIEQKMGAGLIEEILIQAGEELELVKKMKENKPWEDLMEHPEPDQWRYFERE